MSSIGHLEFFAFLAFFRGELLLFYSKTCDASESGAPFTMLPGKRRW